MIRISSIALLCLLSLSPALAADKRVALVIGNSAYQHTPPLANPKNDATDVAAALKRLGFQVLDGFDLDKQSLDRKLRDFATALQGAHVGLFFFAGHGLQVGGHNYLVPIDAQLSTASALDFEMVRLELVQRTMEREVKTNVLFLDSCRDNPLGRNLARAMGTRSTDIGRGLAAMESGVGTLISFSTQPGNVALDGTGRNSPFAGALAKHILSSSDDLSAILIDVRNDVMKETQRRQVPWEHTALTGRFYFHATPLDAKPLRHAEPRRSFDGAWLVDLACPRTPDGIGGFQRQLFARVKDGVLRAETGEQGKPGWLLLEGAIGVDGSARFSANGLSIDSAASLGRVAPGTRYSYAVVANFEGAKGAGKRVGGRECRLTFVRP